MNGFKIEATSVSGKYNILYQESLSTINVLIKIQFFSNFHFYIMIYLRRSIKNTQIILFIIASILATDINQLSAAQIRCPDQFLKNGMFLLKKKKVNQALTTFNQIVQSFPKCPQAEEAQWQLIKYYSKVSRSNNAEEYFQIASDHINLYLFYWPNGAYRSAVLKEQEWNRRSQEPFLMRKGLFISLLSMTVLIVVGLTVASK